MFAALALALLSACGQSARPEAEQSPVVEAPTPDTSIGPTGAAGITSAIAFNIEAARAAAPLFIVADGEGMIEGDAFPIITLAAGDEIVFTLMPAPMHRHLQEIVTESSQARGPSGDVIGQTTFAQAVAAEVMFCRSARPWENFSFTCAASENARFWRAYRLAEGYQGPREPFETIDPDAAVAAALVRMSWFAPRDAR